MSQLSATTSVGAQPVPHHVMEALSTLRTHLEMSKFTEFARDFAFFAEYLPPNEFAQFIAHDTMTRMTQFVVKWAPVSCLRPLLEHGAFAHIGVSKLLSEVINTHEAGVKAGCIIFKAIRTEPKVYLNANICATIRKALWACPSMACPSIPVMVAALATPQDPEQTALLTEATRHNISTRFWNILLSKLSPNVSDTNGDFPILQAIKNMNEDALVCLIRHGASLAATDSKGHGVTEYLDEITANHGTTEPTATYISQLLGASLMCCEELSE